MLVFRSFNYPIAVFEYFRAAFSRDLVNDGAGWEKWLYFTIVISVRLVATNLNLPLLQAFQQLWLATIMFPLSSTIQIT